MKYLGLKWLDQYNYYDVFPNTLAKAEAMQSIGINFIKLVVCPKCQTTYSAWDLIGRGNSPRCSFVRFPRHPLHHMRIKCDKISLKSVRTASGNILFPPIKVFCYQSVIAWLRRMVDRPKMLELLSHWKTINIPHGVCDVYDGAVWKSFFSANVDEVPPIALLINVDWFQPYKHVAYSVGAIYLTNLNLPRQLRYHLENILVVGIIPAPHEPKVHINSYLETLVDDLLDLMKGIIMHTPQGEKKIKAYLICAACDIPASRKLGGFLGHAANKGCSRCLKSFPTERFGDKKL